jgi:primosomal protein N' (replication factor Y)
MFAEIVVDIKHKQLNRVFDYRIPEAWESFCVVGMRVLVSFNHQKVTGIIMHLKEHTKYHEIKDIDEIDTSLPIIDEKQWNLIHELTHTYRMLYAQALDIVIPSAFHAEVITVITKCTDHPLLKQLNISFNTSNQYTLKKKDKHLLITFKKLQRLGVIEISEHIAVKKPLKQTMYYTYVKTNNDAFPHYTDRLDSDKMYSKKELIDVGISASGIKTLIKHTILIEVLKSEQEDINENVVLKLSDKRKWIGHIHHFKDELISLIQYAKHHKESVLILTPNHAMNLYVSKMITTKHHIYHGSLTLNQKRHVIENLHEDALVVGMRSAIFLPFKALKHIVIIDAHDDNYQLHMGLYYDTIDLIFKHFKTSNIILHALLETPYVFELGKKSKTIDRSVLPKVDIISMKDELLQGNTQIISKALGNQIEDTLNQKQKVFILHQRKGYHLVNTCRLCGHTSRCSVCQTLYHVNAKHNMVCPNCNDEKPFEDTCINGHTHMMKPIGIGIEHVAQTLKKMYPSSKIGIITSETNHIDEVIQDHDIIIGTSAIKYHIDAFKDGLIAILIADVLWYHYASDISLQALIHMLYMTNYVTPHLIKPTLIQTYDMSHEVILALYHQETFLKNLYVQQEILMTPPKYMHYEIKIVSESYLKGYQRGLKIKASLESLAHVIGPRKVYDDDDFFTITVKVFKTRLESVLKVFDTIEDEVKPI